MPSDSATARVVCLTKARVGLEETKTRVAVVLGSTGYAVGSEVVVCVMYDIESVTGLTDFVPLNDVAFAKASVRIDHIDEATPLAGGSEPALSGSNWSECTP